MTDRTHCPLIHKETSHSEKHGVERAKGKTLKAKTRPRRTANSIRSTLEAENDQRNLVNSTVDNYPLAVISVAVPQTQLTTEESVEGMHRIGLEN